jgi:hypothetical protein
MNIGIKSGFFPCAVALAVCLSLPAQDVAAGTYVASFKNSKTGRCLHTNDSGTIFTWPCDSANLYQDWNVVEVSGSGGTTFYLKNRKTGRCIATRMGSTVPYSAPCDGSYSQMFFIPITTKNSIQGLGNYRCLNNVSGSLVDSTETQYCRTQSYTLWTSIP